MHVSAVQKIKLPTEWLKVNGQIRVVTTPSGELELEIKRVPNSVRRRSKRREIDKDSTE
jgi:hypothetical protein